MGRPKKEINVKRCENLKTLLSEVKKKNKEENSQTKIAERIHVSQQVLSNIVQQNANLTEDIAARIISQFPEYRIEWLLGYDDLKTYPDEADYYMNKTLSEWQQEDNLFRAMMYIIHSFGYDVVLDGKYFAIIDNETEDYAVLPLSDARNYFDELSYMISSYVRFHFNKLKKEKA